MSTCTADVIRAHMVCRNDQPTKVCVVGTPLSYSVKGARAIAAPGQHIELPAFMAEKLAGAGRVALDVT